MIWLLVMFLLVMLMTSDRCDQFRHQACCHIAYRIIANSVAGFDTIENVDSLQVEGRDHTFSEKPSLT